MEIGMQLLIICPLLFLAGFIDSAAGGGGLIALPAFYMVGLPPHMALGCNKFTSLLGIGTSTARYIKNDLVSMKTALITAVFALAGAGIGTRYALYVSEQVLQGALLVAIPCVAVVVLMPRKNKRAALELDTIRMTPLTVKIFLKSAAIGLGAGLYDGFIGPGGGTFMLLGFSLLLNYDMKIAAGNAKVVNMASNIASVALLLGAGKVYFQLAVPAAFCSILGHYFGSGFVVKKGTRFIRPMLITVLSLLFVRMLCDFLGIKLPS